MDEELKKKALAMAKSVGLRFLKGAVAGASAAASAYYVALPHTLPALTDALYGLVFVVSAGFISGGLLALEKWLNWSDTPPAP